MIPVTPQHSQLKRGIALTLLAVFILSLASVLVRGIQKVPIIQIIFIQNLVSFFCVVPLVVKQGLESVKTESLLLHLARDLFGVASYFFFFLAIRYLGLVDATLLNYTAPFWIPFIWRIWYNEEIPKNIWWSIIIGFIGMAIILKPTKAIFALGFFCGLSAGICSAIAFVALRMLNLKHEPMRRALFYYFSLGAILSFPFLFSVWQKPSFVEWIMMIGIGIFTAAGQMLLTVAYRYGTAAHLSPIGYVSIVYNGVFAYLIFGQSFGWQAILGTVLIFSGGMLTYLFETKK